MKQNLSAIVAIAQNNAIGKNGDLLCYLPADLKHFKNITMGHTIIMGRRTWDSLPKGALPGRKNVVITRNTDFVAQGAEVYHSLEEALAATATDERRFIIGGGMLYREAFPLTTTLHLTLIHAAFPDADTFFPQFDMAEWDEFSREDHEADERNPYPYSFVDLRRK